MSTRTHHPKTPLGENIRNARVAKDLSQRELAHSIGHEGEDAGAYISRVESGETVPRVDTLRKIAEVLDVEISELLT